MKLPFFHKLVSAMEIPEDLSEKAALVELTGQNAVRVENYLGIVEYTDSALILQCKGCRLQVVGKNLHILSYTREELVLGGQIEQVHYF